MCEYFFSVLTECRHSSHQAKSRGQHPDPKFLITFVARAADLPSAVLSLLLGAQNAASKSSAAGALI